MHIEQFTLFLKVPSSGFARCTKRGKASIQEFLSEEKVLLCLPLKDFFPDSLPFKESVIITLAGPRKYIVFKGRVIIINREQ